MIAPREAIPQIEAGILSLKQKFDIPAEKELHCRLLCSPNGRSKGGFEHLNRSLVESLLYEAFELMASHGVAIRYSIADYRQHRNEYGDNLAMGSLIGEKAVHKIHRLKTGGIDPKAILPMMSGQVWAAGLMNGTYPTARDCDIFVSADSSIVRFIGSKHKAAHDHYSIFLDMDAPPGHIYKVEPAVTNYSNSFMVQLADIAAFTSSHAGYLQPELAFYRGLFQIYPDAICYPYNPYYPPSLLND